MPPELAAHVGTLVVLGLVAAVTLGSAVAGIVRDSEWWVTGTRGAHTQRAGQRESAVRRG